MFQQDRWELQWVYCLSLYFVLFSIHFYFLEYHSFYHSHSWVLFFSFFNLVMLVDFRHYRVKVKPIQKFRCSNTMLGGRICEFFIICIGQADEFVPITFYLLTNIKLQCSSPLWNFLVKIIISG